MNCRHCNEEGHCTLFNKNANEASCKNCVMRIVKNNGQDLFNELFSHFGGKGVK